MIGISEEPTEEDIAFTSSAIDDFLSVLYFAENEKFLGLQENEVRVVCMEEYEEKQNGHGALL